MIAGPFNIAINKGPNFAVVSPDGYINQTGGGQLADACGDLIDEGLTHLILNLTKAPIVSSVGIACLIEVIERANNGGVRGLLWLDARPDKDLPYHAPE